MDGQLRGRVPEDLARVAEQFLKWRRSRTVGARIPASLWQLALELADRHGISRTATVLKVGYYCLKKRMSKCNLPASVRRPVPGPGRPGLNVSPPNFVELPPRTEAFGSSECVLEFEKGSGARLRVSFKGQSLPDLSALGRDFWEVG